MTFKHKIAALTCGLIALSGFAMLKPHYTAYAANDLRSIGDVSQSLAQNAFKITKGNGQMRADRSTTAIHFTNFTNRKDELKNNQVSVGWPYHQSAEDGSLLWDTKYNNNKTMHDTNIVQHLHVDKDSTQIFRATFPKDASTSQAKNYSITINYKDAVVYDGKKYDAKLTINNIKYYDQDYWAGPTNLRPDIWFNNNITDGIWFDGITSAKATLNVLGLSWHNDRPAYVSFNGLDAVNKPNQEIDELQQQYNDDGDQQQNAVNSFWNNEFFFKRRAQNHYTFFNSVKSEDWLWSKWDQTGKWVNWDDGSVGYKYVSQDNKKQSDIDNYYSKVEKMKVNGGRAGTTFNNSKSSYNYFSHSIVFKIDNNKTQKNDGIGTTFTFGSGEGYGNFTITTNTLIFQPHDRKDPTGDTGSIKKTVNNYNDTSNRIHHQNDTFTYHLTGKLPSRTSGYEYYQDTNDVIPTVNLGNASDQYYYTVNIPKWKQHPLNDDDYADIVDNVPDSLKVTSAYSDTLNVKVKGNRVSVHLSYKQLLQYTSNNKQDYDITINVKASNLPQPNDTGFHDDGPNGNGLFHIKNKARMSGQMLGQPFGYDSNETDTTIQRRKGIIHHYDFDHDNKGDFNGFGIDWGNDNFQNKTNYDGSKIRDDTYVYGYENDTKNIHADDNIYDNAGAHFLPYVESGSVTLGSNDSSDDDDMIDNFYMPYYQTKYQVLFNLMKIDTNKWKDGLPFHISQRNQSFLYKDLSQYNDGSETISIYQVLNNGDKVKVYDTTKNFTDMLGQGPHSDYWWNIDGTLSNLVDPSTGQKVDNPTNSFQAGKKINFVVEATFNNPHKISIPQSGTKFSTYGFISSDATLNNDSFNNNNYAVMNPVERTIAYNGAKQIRELREAIRLDQDRTANAKTGYGMKNDLKLTYAGWNNVNNLNNIDFMNKSAQLNYVFPQAFASNGLDHDADSIQKDRDSGFKNSDSAINYNAYNGTNALNDDLDGSNKGHFLQDRLEQLTNYQNNDSLTPAIDGNNTKATLDSFNNASKDDVNRMNDARNINWDNPVNEFTETPISFTNEYRFYDRIVNFGVNLPNGVVGLGSNADPEASNKVGFDAQNTDGGYRFYTPYWLSLKTDSADGNWPTYWERVNNDRFGANWFNINDRRPVTFYGHMYLANNSKSDQGDELSIQPIMTAKQIPNGFSQSQIDWLKHYATFK